MTAFKKRLLVVSALLVGSLGLVTIGFEKTEETERKERFARNPQSNIVPVNASGEVVGTGARRLGPRTFGESIKDVDLSKASPFVKGIAARTTRRIKRLEQLPTDIQKNIESYLDRYVLWKTLYLEGPQGVDFRHNQSIFRVDGQNLVLVVNDREGIEIAVISIETGQKINNFFIQRENPIITDLLLSSDGKTIAFIKDDPNMIGFFNIKTGTTRYIHHKLETDSNRRRLLCFNPDGTTLALQDERSGGGRGKVILFNVSSSSFISLDNSTGASEEALSYALSNDTFAVANNNAGRIHFFATSNGERKMSFDMKERKIKEIRFSHNGKIFAVEGYFPEAFKKESIQLFNYDAHQHTLQERMHITGYYPSWFFLSYDGKQVLVSGDAGLVLFDTLTHKRIQTFESSLGNDATFSKDAIFSKDGKNLSIAFRHREIIQFWKKIHPYKMPLKNNNE